MPYPPQYGAETQSAVFRAGIRWLVDRYECTCNEAFAERGLPDPRCIRCQLEETIEQHDIDISFIEK